MNENEVRDHSGILRGLQPKALMKVVCIAGAVVGALAGASAGAFFGSYSLPLGTLLGALGGIVAGVLWTWIMLRRARAGFGRGRLIAAGTIWGIVVGLLATVILQGGLFITAMVLGQVDDGSYLEIFIIWQVAFVCAVIGGAITGAICGGIVPLKE